MLIWKGAILCELTSALNKWLSLSDQLYKITKMNLYLGLANYLEIREQATCAKSRYKDGPNHQPSQRTTFVEVYFETDQL